VKIFKIFHYLRLTESLTKMKLKELEGWLQSLAGFEKPKVKLEQYETPAHIASRMIHTMESSFGDITGQMVCDIGCGAGMLTVGAAMMGAAVVHGFDIDPEALDICQENVEEMELTNVDLVQLDINSLLHDGPASRLQQAYDTVVLNPPFGTKHNLGADMDFLRVALMLTKNAVYSLHKSSTREHITKKAQDWGVKMQVIAELKYNLPNTYKFHKKKSIDIEVDFIRFYKLR